MANKEVNVNGLSIGYKVLIRKKFISWTDIACMRKALAPADVVKN